MSRHQTGYIWRVGRSWYGRWREDVIESGAVVRKQRSEKLADVCDRYRTKRDVRPLLEGKLKALNEGRTRPEGTLTVAEFVEGHYFPFVRENFKPSTIAGYGHLWRLYLSARLTRGTVRDFRTVDAAHLLADVHRAHGVNRTTLKHVKSFLSGVFRFAKNQGVFDGMNPIHDAMIPRKAAAPLDTHAATLEQVLAMMDALDRAGEKKTRAAVALMFFAGLRPGEARGARWEDYDGKRLAICQSVWKTHTTTPKTAGSAKPVPVIEPLAAVLAELRELDGNPQTGPILRGPSGAPLDLHNLAARVMMPRMRKAGIPWHGWYALRRGIATTIAGMSKDAFAAKGLLRHSSVSTTERHYIKDVPANTQAAMKLLENLCKICTTEEGSKPAN
jgi:integrase